MRPWAASLDRWLIGRFLRAYGAFLGAAVVLFLVLDLSMNVDLAVGSFSDASARTRLFERYALYIPELFFLLSPHLVLLSGLWTVVAVVRQNELVPLLSAGYSNRRLVLPFLAVGLILAGFTWADRELVLPALGDLRRERLLKQSLQFMRPIPDSGDAVLSSSGYLTHTQELYMPRLVRLDPRGAEVWSVMASWGSFDEQAGAWRFVDGIVFERGAEGETLRRIGPEGLLVRSGIGLRDVEAAIDAPSYLSADGLDRQLERTPGFKHLAVQRYERFTQGLAGVILLLAGLPLLITEARGASLALRSLACLGLSVAYFLGATICYELGARAVLSPPVAALLPLVVLGGAGLLALFAPRGWVAASWRSLTGR